MDEQASAPPTTGGEQRTLASIMFTDVVSFSKHSEIDEAKTYRALNRDFDLIYQAVAEHNGQVLNTMGDGMMVVFSSAIQCMQCAIKIQGELYRQGLNRPVDGILQHRLGLHIGDVILNGKNTMGDSVNQAARIQAIARPESIAMSREFYEVVVNKTPFKAKYLGPQRAKNIHDAIPIWEVSPIDDEIRQRAAEALYTPQTNDAPDGATGRRSVVILIAVLLLLILASAPIFLLRSANNAASKRINAFKPGKSGKEVAENVSNLLHGKKPDSNNEAVNSASNNAPAKPTSLSLNASEVEAVSSKTNTHDYSGVVEVLRKATGADSEDGKAMIKKYEDLTAFQKWIDTELGATSDGAPIMATVDGFPVKVYATSTGTVIDNGTPTTRNFWEYKESTIVAIAEAIAAKPPTGQAPPAEAITWIATFKDVHKV